ncbi:glutamyl-tRNA reductase [Alkaliphilus hydrothermalis]|uniref:Glutamyl-tRNA reductase n=1 Tax=Alkaliphilus hydrothermalis TaxID=1482730 RepID=A0ABS2NP42_9FIRM|nr:glutamyl-tRNA reductase [Alkaliphilus hydrothermalis]MBM7614714.1 glutamyl-tRNA reductase [Alkaliphilus hydrothermalis]
MKIMVFGVTHKNSSIALREKVAYSRSKLEKAYAHLKESAFVEEAVIVSTCNRSEVFAIVEDIEKGTKWFKNFYQNFFHLQPQELEGHYIAKTGREAIEYLYEVCCGLDSLVLGEDQILGQVKEAHQKALDHSATGKVLNRLFLEAVTVAKELKTKTAISENPLSISSIAVKQMETSLGGLAGKRILVVGYGEMSRIAIENLLEKEVDTIYICNRTSGAIEALEKKYPQIKYLPYEEKYSKINEIDAVLSATSAPHYIFHYDEVKELYKGEGSVCMVDIALPRDIDPLLEGIKGMTLYHIDHLKAVVEESLLYRQQCIEEMKEFIQKSVDKYIEWYRCLPIYPRIKALKSYSQKMTDEELEGLFKKLSHMEEKDKELIEVVVRSLIKKMWKKPILQMKHAGVNGRGEQVAAVVDELFDLNTNIRNE